MKEYYTINNIALMSGLTTRTIRNYIKMGVLNGEKIDGVWQFTPKEVDRFFEHPNVLPSIQAKRNAIVFDFILNKQKETNQMCVILDLPGEDGQKISDFFTEQYNSGNYSSDLLFSFECTAEYPRVILKGQAEDVVKLLNLFHRCHSSDGGQS